MALDIDGLAVLRNIAAHPAAFSEVTTEVAPETAKVARALVTKQLKSKSLTLKNLRDVRKALGAETFNLILDGVADAQIKSVVAKIDKNHPDLKTSNPQWRRRQLGALADGSAESAEKVKAAPKPKGGKQTPPKAAEEPQRLDYSSAGATRKRGG